MYLASGGEKPTVGLVLVKAPGAGRSSFVPLTEASQFVSGAEVDARVGALRLTAATGRSDHRQTALIAGGVFTVSQSHQLRKQNITTTLSLLTGMFPRAPSYHVCAGSASVTRNESGGQGHVVLQTLSTQVHGGTLVTRGRDSTGSAQDATWETIEKMRRNRD